MIHLAVFGIDTGMAALLTYLVHSTAWFAAALLLTHLRRLSPAARHTLWRATLFGPLASSALMLGVCVCHRWQWAVTHATSAREASAPPLLQAAALPLARPVELLRESTPLGAEATPRVSWSAVCAAGWALVALAGLLLIARAAARQRRALRARTPVTDGAGAEALGRLVRRAGFRRSVRLSRCATASTPCVLSAREVCLPDRALELDREALEAVLAHELAHIERRDRLWLNAALLLQVLLWFQPLNRKARAELQATAELAADDRAVELTGNALGLARTLTQVASWSSGSRFAPAVAMARADSPIVERVERLVESGDARTRGGFGSRTPWLTLAALAAIGACAPSVGAPRGELARAMPAPASPGGDPARGVAPPGAALPPVALPPAALPPATPPALPIQGRVDDVVASVAPAAREFEKSVVQLALNEQHLGMQIALAEQAAAQPGAPANARDEIARWKQELAASSERRQRLEREFEARMEVWRQQFEARFERDHAAKMAAWSEQFERRMQGMAKDLERRLSGLRELSMPAPPPPLPQVLPHQ